MAKKKDAATETGPPDSAIVLRAPDGVETIGTESGVLKISGSVLELDRATHGELAQTLVRHFGFVEVVA